MTKEGYTNFIHFTTDVNDNNNETDAINYNKQSNPSIANVSNNGFLSMSGCSNNDLLGAASLAFQTSLQSSSSTSFASSSGYVGSLEMNIHPAFDNVHTFSSENNNSNESDGLYQMHSTKISTNESFDSFETNGQKSFEVNNLSNGDDKENSGFFESKLKDLRSSRTVHELFLFHRWKN